MSENNSRPSGKQLNYSKLPSSIRRWQSQVLGIFMLIGMFVLVVAAIAAYALFRGFREMERVTMTVINQSDYDVIAVHIMQQYPNQPIDILKINAVAKGSQASETIHLSNDEGPCDVVIQVGNETYVGRTAPLVTDNGPFEYTAYVRDGRIHIEGSGSAHAYPFDLERTTPLTTTLTPK